MQFLEEFPDVLKKNWGDRHQLVGPTFMSHGAQYDSRLDSRSPYTTLSSRLQVPRSFTLLSSYENQGEVEVFF